MSEKPNSIVARLIIEAGILSVDKVDSEFSHWQSEPEGSFDEYLVHRNLLSDHEAKAIRVLADRSQKFLDAGADEPTANESESLLATVRGESRAFDTVPDENFLELGKQRSTLKGPGSRLTSSDRFQVKSAHARGGLGEVFIAEDTELNRDVALKRIKPNMSDRTDMRKRFLLEAELTGGLEHPGVVPVYGLGQSPDGRPYYAMRFIRGESLGEAIKQFHENYRINQAGEATLRFRKLLQFMIAVCNTIHYAHTRGVLHRDIKPDNIMLGEFGEALVVDWGLARTFVDPGTGQREDVSEPIVPAAEIGKPDTILGVAVGTPGYMSPRQASGKHDSMQPSDDVYSLGATLFNLLTLKRPYNGQIIAFDETETQQLSASPRLVNTDIPLPLDAICQKSLSLDEGQRYDSAKELASDLEAYLADEPVTAWREPMSVRLMRWFRQHKTIVASVVAAVLVATIGLAIASLLLDQARRREIEARAEIALQNEQISGQRKKLVEANRIAETNLAQARTSIDEWYTLIADSDELKSTPRTEKFRRKLLERARDYYQGFLEQSGGDPEIRQEAALAAFRLGTITRELEPGEKAIEFYDRAIDEFQKLTNEYPKKAEYWTAMYDAINGKSIVLSRQLGKIDEALIEADELSRVVSEIVKLDPESLEGKKLSLSAQQNKAGILIKAGKTADALESYRDIVPSIRSLIIDYPDDSEIQESLAAVLFNRGSIYSAQLENESARKDLEEAVQIWNDLVVKDDTEHARFQLANTATNLGLLYNRLKERSKALQTYDLVVENAEELATDHPDIADYSHLLVKGITNRAQVIQSNGNVKKANEDFNRALIILQRLSDRFPDVTEYISDAATIQFNIAFSLADSGQDKDALESFADAERKFAKLFESNPDVISSQMRLTVAQIQLAQQHMVLNQNEAAAVSIEKAVSNGQQLVDRAPDVRNYLRILSSALNVQGRILTENGDRQSAETVFNRTIEIRSKLADLSPNDPSAKLQLADVYYNFAIFHDGGGNQKQVVVNMKHAIEIIDELKELNIPLPTSLIATEAIADYHIARYQDDESKRVELLQVAIESLKSALESVPLDPHLKKYLEEANRELDELEK